MLREQEHMILRLWRDWCRLWPEQYGHESLQVKPQGYDPVFDIIPSQAYKDFYFEVVRGHPMLKHINAFEVIDTALNQIRAPETPVFNVPSVDKVAASGVAARAPARAADHVRIAEVTLSGLEGENEQASNKREWVSDEADTA